jgi:YcaO-like protein with predicted kinase domain
MFGVRNEGASPTAKRVRAGTDRVLELSITFERALALRSRLGITRIANITGLDRLGVPVVAVHRPNSRSVSVAQGKGVSLLAAQVSGLMESIEGYHAEHVGLPLLLGSYRELRAKHRVIDPHGLPRLSTSCFEPGLPLLWVTGQDLATGAAMLVPYELVHTDFRLPFPTGTGAFVMSSNGLASGNHLLEAISHAICELVERDANSLWHVTGAQANGARRVDLSSIDDVACRALLDCYESRGLSVGVWETTTDVGICSFLCTLAERDAQTPTAMMPISGSGCHPRRQIALSRALTEAAQGRLTLISGSRDDLSVDSFDTEQARHWSESLQRELAAPGSRRFSEAPDYDAESLEQDVQWELERLRAAGLEQVMVVNLTKADVGIPVVRVIVPHLEAMSEVVGYVPGRRARSAAEGLP